LSNPFPVGGHATRLPLDFAAEAGKGAGTSIVGASCERRGVRAQAFS